MKPFAGLVRLDDMDYPVVITKGSVFVTAGTDRRSSGTHYTPKSLTEPIVQYTLEPLVYFGPAEGLPKDQWKLRSAKELLALKICDMACGSGAFLVQACRYMAARLLEAWDAVQRANPGKVHITPEGEASIGKPGEMLIPDDPDERQTYALRIVAQRCLYGVDKNPLAAEMAKLSLWLLTLAKDKPFEFLDHAIRCGDSLVGINNIEQLRKFDLQPNAPGAIDFPGEFDEPVNEAMQLRRQITEMQGNTVEIVDAQERILREANEKIDQLRYAADMLIGAEFLRWDQHELIQEELDDEEQADSDDEHWQPSWLKAKKETAQFRRAARKRAWNNVIAYFKDSDLDTFRHECPIWLNGQTPFHWPLEFPEVMVEHGGFDAFVGNPPFITGTSISSILNEPYRNYLKELWPHFGGRADICVAFFLRGTSLMRRGGSTGFIGTDTVSEGDSRVSGPAFLLRNGYTIFRAVKRQKWPGVAAVKVCHIHIYRGVWNGTFVLDGILVENIDSSFDAGEQLEEPKPLASSQAMSFTGTKVYGNGFVLSIDEGKQLLLANERNRRVIKPYLVGRELNHADCSPGRYIIDFTGMTRTEAEAFPEPWSIVYSRVRADRQSAPEKAMREQFWLFQRPRKELYSLLAVRGNAWLIAATSDTVAFVAVEYSQDKPVVFSHAVNVLALDGYGHFAVVQSSIHLGWARRYGSSMKGDMRYTTTDCFENFPFPSNCNNLVAFGEKYYRLRHQLGLERRIGLTDLYQLMHQRSEASEAIGLLRLHHAEMDNAVAAAYGWTDLDLGHGFHETKQAVRYTISEVARREILVRLLKLNHERYADEVKQGLHEKKAKGSAAAKRKPKAVASDRSTTTMPTLFDMDGLDVAFPNTDRERLLCGLLCDCVAAEPGLRFDLYLDNLLIAIRPQKYNRLFIGEERTKFTKLAEKLSAAGGQADASIPWGNLVEVLSQNEVIRKSAGDTFNKGSRFDTMRSSYPPCDPKLVALIQKAAATLREFQDLGNSAPKQAKEIVAQNVEDRRTLAGATK